ALNYVSGRKRAAQAKRCEEKISNALLAWKGPTLRRSGTCEFKATDSIKYFVIFATIALIRSPHFAPYHGTHTARVLHLKDERGSGEVVSVAGPYTIPLISPDMQYEGEDEVFSFKYITDCAKNNRQLNKRSQFKPEFNFCDILEKKITWSEARSRWKIDNINLDPSPLLQTLSSLKPTSRSYTLKEERTILKYIADNDMYDKVKGRFMWQSMASSQVGNKRTWQSLKEHFIKSMIPRIDSFNLTKQEKNKFMCNPSLSLSSSGLSFDVGRSLESGSFHQ
ncbi:unnamed protein product, partial [Timema podura]|nr:unnamed protein product [Timema podura]